MTRSNFTDTYGPRVVVDAARFLRRLVRERAMVFSFPISIHIT